MMWFEVHFSCSLKFVYDAILKLAKSVQKDIKTAEYLQGLRNLIKPQIFYV